MREVGSASCFKEQQDFACGLWAGRHWGIVKAQDLIVLHGEDKLGSHAGDRTDSAGDTHKVPRDQGAWTRSRSSLWLRVPLLPPAWRHRGI